MGDNTPHGFSLAITKSIGHRNTYFTYTALANDFVTSLHVYGTSIFGTNTIDIAVYQISIGIPKFLKSPVYQLSFTAALPSWKSISIPPLALVAGITYCVAIGQSTRGFNVRYRLSIPHLVSAENTNTLPLIWNEAASLGQRLSMYATITNIPPAPKQIDPCCAQLIPTAP